jgi:hypothetical protein
VCGEEEGDGDQSRDKILVEATRVGKMFQVKRA